MAPRLRDRFDVANELQSIAQALLGMKEDRATAQRAAIPLWLSEIPAPGCKFLRPPTPFVTRPAALEIAAQQVKHGSNQMGFVVLGLKAYRFVKVTRRLVE